MERVIQIVLAGLILVAIGIFVSESRQQKPLERATQEQGINALEQNQPVEKVSLPDFASIQDVNQKKQAFQAFLLPAIHQSNEQILEERTFLQALDFNNLSKPQARRLALLADKYQQPRKAKQTKAQWRQALLKKVDIIPPSLALAQAANESAWGTSRFATEGLNFYGQWCFSEGCGLVPEERPDGKKYEVRLFKSPSESVQAYMTNLNAFHTYRDFRQLRLDLRNKNQVLTGEKLAKGLLAYSQRREEYIKEIQAMIRFNDWHLLDQDWVRSLSENQYK